MEAYRILSNKKILLTVLIFFIVNLILSFGIENQKITNESGSNIFVIRTLLQQEKLEQMDDAEIAQKCGSLQNIIILYEYYKESAGEQTDEEAFISEQEISIRESDPETAAWFDENKDGLDVDEIRAYYYIYADELEKRDYLNSYSDYLSETIEESEHAAQISIFNNSFSQKSFELLSRTFTALGTLKLQNTNTAAFEKTVTNNATNVLLVLLVLLLCVILFYNKDKNVSLIIRSCKNGRMKLFFSRLFASSFLILLSVIGLFAENFILYGFFYGYDIDLSLRVQCGELFKSFYYGISLLEFSVMFFAVKFFTLLVIFLIIYLLLYVLSDLNTLVLFLTLFAGAEYLLYKYIAVYSNFSILHTANILSFLNDDNWITYGVFNLFSTPVKIFDGMLVSLFVFLAVLIITNALVAKNVYTIRTKNRLQLRINRSVQKVASVFSVIKDKWISDRGEFYKLFVSQKFLFVLVAVVLVFLNTYSFGTVEKLPLETYLDHFYAQYSGELNEAAYQKIKELNSMVAENEFNTQLAEEAYMNGEISFEEYSVQISKYSSNDTITNALRVIESQIEYIEAQKSEGKTVYLMDETGYNHLFGADTSQSDTVQIITFLLMLLFLTYGLISKDKNKDILCLLRSTVNGRRRLLKTKLKMGFMITTVAYMAWVVIEIIYFSTYFNLDNLSAPVQSLQIFAKFPLSMNILTFTILFYLSKYIVFLSVFYIFTAVNIFLENKISIIINFVLVISPCLLGFLGLDMISDFSITGILDFTPRYASDSSYLNIYCWLLLILLFTSPLLNIFMLKSSDKKGESL